MARFQLPAGIRTEVWRQNGISIAYPVVYGLMNRQAEMRINQSIRQTLTVMIQEQLRIQTGTNVQMTGHYEIKTNERGLLSLILTVEAYSYPMAHGHTVAKALTFEVNNGRSFALSDLFRRDSNFEQLLANQVAAQIRERNIPVLSDTVSVAPDQDFYLADKSLVLFFPLYALSPYYVGIPMFPISVYNLQDVWAENGPLDVLSVSVV